jgi:hypothetical protein
VFGIFPNFRMPPKIRKPLPATVVSERVNNDDDDDDMEPLASSFKLKMTPVHGGITGKAEYVVQGQPTESMRQPRTKPAIRGPDADQDMSSAQ